MNTGSEWDIIDEWTRPAPLVSSWVLFFFYFFFLSTFGDLNSAIFSTYDRRVNKYKYLALSDPLQNNVTTDRSHEK